MKGITSGLQPVRLKDGGFPDLSGDGQVTQKDILIGKGVIKKRNGGIAAFAEGGEADSKTKLVGKDGLLFDYTSPTDYALLIPGLGLVGLGAKALTKGAKITDVINKAFKLAGKPGQKVLGKPTKTLSGPGVKGGQTVVPSGRSADALDDFLIGRGRDRILGTTKTGQAARISAAIGVGGKMLPDGSEEEVVETIAPPAPPVEAPDTRTFFEKLKDLPGDTYKNLQDDPAFRAKFLAGSMNMMKPVEGIVPVSGVNQFYEGFEAKGKEQLAMKLAAAKIKAATKGDSVLENVLAGTKQLDQISMLPSAISQVLYGGVSDLIATPAGAEFMGVEPGSEVTGSMMTTLIQSLQSQGLSGPSLEQAIKTAVQPPQVSE